MRRFASVFTLRKPSSSASESSTDDQANTKQSWKKWLNTARQQKEEKQPLIDDADDEGDELDTTTLIAMTMDSLAAPSTSQHSPFVQPEGPMFPRSVNIPLLLPRQQSLRVRVLKSALLQHHNKSSTSCRPLSPPCSDFPNISRPKGQVQLPSRGIHRWVSRPCFEERYLVYLPSPSGIKSTQVSASLPIASLEYPEYLDVMAQHQECPKTTTPSHPALPSMTDPPRSSQTPVLYPLQKEHPPPVHAPPSTSQVTKTVTPVSPTSPVKRIVRFAPDNDEDDSSDDMVPLHFIRQKNKRQEKAKFLQQERLRRAREEDEGRKRHEKEATERAKQYAMLEAERAQSERVRREREQTAFADEVVKTRIRREMQRAGGVPALVMREKENNFGVSSSSSERNKSPLTTLNSGASLRGVAPSSPSPLPNTHQHQTPSDSSPSSSRPSSTLVPSPASQGTRPLQSRPSSTYSSSSESAGKRNSFIAVPSSLGPGSPPMMPTGMPINMPTYAIPSPMIMTFPPYATSNPNLSYMTPVVPSFPDYMTSDFDMPLLPPTAPFMKQPSYERRKNSLSTSGSERNPSPGFTSSAENSRRGSFSSSSEKLVPPAGGNQERGRKGPALSGLGGTQGKSAAISALGQGASAHSLRSASGPVWSSSSKDRLRTLPVKSATMPPPMPTPWTGVPTAQQIQMEMEMVARGESAKMPMAIAQMAPGGGGSKKNPRSTDGVDGGSATQSGGSSSTSTRRGTIGSGVVKNRSSYSAWNHRQVAIS